MKIIKLHSLPAQSILVPVILCVPECAVERLEDLLRDESLGPGLVETHNGVQVVPIPLLGGLLLLLLDVVVVVVLILVLVVLVVVLVFVVLVFVVFFLVVFGGGVGV